MDAVQLAEQHPHPGGLGRRLHLQQLLDRQHEDELVVLKREVVDPLGVRDRLPPRLLLHVLLEAGVEVADDGLEPFHLLAVQVDDQSQDAMGRRVVRPEVDLEDVALFTQGGIHLQDRGDRGRDPRPLVDLGRRPLDDSHYSASENRTGSPPSG
jgi:hypothetical protein